MSHDRSGATMAALEAIAAAFNDHDLERIMSFFSDDCVLEMPRGPEPWGARHEGRAAVRAALAGRLEGIPDVHYAADTHIAAGEWGASRWLLTGTMRDGRHIAVRGCDFFRFRDGEVVLKDSYWKIVEQAV